MKDDQSLQFNRELLGGSMQPKPWKQQLEAMSTSLIHKATVKLAHNKQIITVLNPQTQNPTIQTPINFCNFLSFLGG